MFAILSTADLQQRKATMIPTFFYVFVRIGRWMMEDGGWKMAGGKGEDKEGNMH